MNLLCKLLTRTRPTFTVPVPVCVGLILLFRLTLVAKATILVLQAIRSYPVTTEALRLFEQVSMTPPTPPGLSRVTNNLHHENPPLNIPNKMQKRERRDKTNKRHTVRLAHTTPIPGKSAIVIRHQSPSLTFSLLSRTTRLKTYIHDDKNNNLRTS